AAEAEVARFAERVGQAPGVAFRLTRASVVAGAGAGLTRDDVLGVLARASSKPLAPNVAREIDGWLAGVRRVRVRTAALLECPDEETAARVHAALAGKAERLTPTVFALPGAAPGGDALLLKRLRAAGVFLDGRLRGAADRPAARRGRGARRGPDDDAFE
ncbi:MAG TPA: helicase-associated domain-containing protein, partial [Gemmatirosa sp.]